MLGSDKQSTSSKPAGAFDLLILSDLVFNHSQHRAMLQTIRSCLRRAANLPDQEDESDKTAEMEEEISERFEDMVSLSTASADSLPSSLPPLVTTESTAPQALVFFSHHRPWLAARDLRFFELATSDSKRHGGFHVERILERQMEPMFANDPGSEAIRSTVHGYRLTLRSP
jgi:nicotinamide N-methyltransferase